MEFPAARWSCCNRPGLSHIAKVILFGSKTMCRLEGGLFVERRFNKSVSVWGEVVAGDKER